MAARLRLELSGCWIGGDEFTVLQWAKLAMPQSNMLT